MTCRLAACSLRHHRLGPLSRCLWAGSRVAEAGGAREKQGGRREALRIAPPAPPMRAQEFLRQRRCRPRCTSYPTLDCGDHLTPYSRRRGPQRLYRPVSSAERELFAPPTGGKNDLTARRDSEFAKSSARCPGMIWRGLHNLEGTCSWPAQIPGREALTPLFE